MSVDDAVRSHVSWLTALAGVEGGATWTDGPVRWAWVPPHRTLHGLFPDATPPDVVARAVGYARDHHARDIGIWSAVDTDRPELLEQGFELGWQPTWMAASTEGFSDGAALLSRRVTRTVHTREHDRARQPLLDRDDTARFEARTEGGRYAGRAWLHVTGDVAGLYDMGVWSRFQRRGYGTDLVDTIGAAARRAGADRITLNATPEGEKLYGTCGFVVEGHGRTWWWHADQPEPGTD